MQKILMLAAVTKINRHAAMALVNDLVVELGGWISGHTLYGNMAAAFHSNLPPARLADFSARLDAAQIRLDESGAAGIDAAARSGSEECRLSLNITFIHGEPDITHPVPAVPG